MKSIEELAKEYTQKRLKDYETFFGEDLRKESLKWNNPKCPPGDYREILVKVKDGYNIARYNPGKGYCIGYCGKGGFYTEIIGWREIHELY